ncbi:MAG: hypothetical protein ACLQVD_22395 [Capsulimonadaceae bacterium]
MVDTQYEDLEARTVIGSTLSYQQNSYHLTNQTNAGDSAEYPVITDATLSDLKVIQWFADGTFREIGLIDIDGTPLDVLESGTVYLESVQNAPQYPWPIEAVTVSGAIHPATLEVRHNETEPARVVRVAPRFWIDIVDPAPGHFIALTVGDREGNRYTVGTFGIGIYP